MSTMAAMPRWSVAYSTPRAMAISIWTTCEVSRMRRRSTRSATAPPSTMKASSGASAENWRRPR